jgi:enoyl-CoA hydratase/carnithine racemase
VKDLALTLAGNAPLSLRAAKLTVAAAVDPDSVPPDGMAAAVAACFDSEDYREGRAAFAAKRAPVFRGR